MSVPLSSVGGLVSSKSVHLHIHSPLTQTFNLFNDLHMSYTELYSARNHVISEWVDCQTVGQTHMYTKTLELHISVSRSHKSGARTIPGSVLCSGAGRGCPGVKEGMMGKKQSKHCSCGARVSPSWPFLLFGAQTTSCGTAAAKPRSLSAP